MAPSTSPASSDGSVTDDPHIRNLAQESFSVNQPGKYTFLRVPLALSQPALLEVTGEIRTLEGSSCKMYTTLVSVSGGWLGDRAVHVRPLQRSAPGAGERPDSPARACQDAESRDVVLSF